MYGASRYGSTIDGGEASGAPFAPPGIPSSEAFGAVAVTGGAVAYYIQTIASVASSSTPVTVPITSAPAPPSAKNTLLMFATRTSNQVFTSATDTKGNTWVKDIDRPAGGGTAAIWRCSSYTTALTTADSVTLAGGLGLGGSDVTIIEVAGLVASPLDQTGIGDNSVTPPSGTVNVVSSTLGQAIEIAVTVMGNDGTAGTFTYSVSGSGGITWNQLPNIANWMGGVAWGMTSSTAAQGANWSFTTSSGNHVAAVIATYKVIGTLQPAGISGGGGFGTPTIANVTGRNLSPSGVASAEAFGSGTVTRGHPQALAPSGIASAQAFGAPTVTLGRDVKPTGIASAQALGKPKVQRHRTGAQIVSPTGVTSAQAFGTPTVTASVVFVGPTGIPGAEAFGLEGIGRPFIIPVATGTAALPLMLVRRSGLRH
jgi:hypothetical protein